MNPSLLCNRKQPLRTVARVLLAGSIAVTGIIGSLAVPASAQTSPGAKAHNIESAEQYAAEAFVAYGRKDYRRALNLYKKALQAAPGANILYNLARIYDLGLHERVHAMLMYRRYLDHPSAIQPRSEYAEVRIAELQAAAPVASHSKSVQNLPKTVASLPAASKTPQRPPPTITLVTLNPKDEGTTTVSPATTADPWTTKEISSAVLGGAGLVSLLVAARLGASAYWENDDWRSSCDGDVCNSQQALDSVHRASSQANRATVALAAGASLVTLASALLWAPIGEPEQDTDVSWDLQLPSGQAGLAWSVSGKF